MSVDVNEAARYLPREKRVNLEEARQLSEQIEASRRGFWKRLFGG